MILSGTKAPNLAAATDTPPSHPTGPGVAGEGWEVDNIRSDLGEPKVISSAGPFPPAGTESEGAKKTKKKRKRKKSKSAHQLTTRDSETNSSVEQGNE